MQVRPLDFPLSWIPLISGMQMNGTAIEPASTAGGRGSRSRTGSLVEIKKSILIR
jgi:hypothetical protein